MPTFPAIDVMLVRHIHVANSRRAALRFSPLFARYLLPQVFHVLPFDSKLLEIYEPREIQLFLVLPYPAT